MPLEMWSTFASVGTFVVIAATAIAALIQLRHTRSSNQIAAVTEMRETFESERFRQARHFVLEQVPTLLADPQQRNKLAGESLPPEFDDAREMANFFETMGVFVKHGIVDQALVCDIWDGVVFKAWKRLEPVVMIRRTVSDRGLWANFEYLAVLCERSLAKNQGDHYPSGVERMKIDQSSREIAEAFSIAAHEPQDNHGSGS